MRIAALAPKLCARQRFRQQESNTNAKFYRITDLRLYEGEIGTRAIFDADPRASCGYSASARGQGRARNRANRNRQNAGVPDPGDRATNEEQNARNRGTGAGARELAMQVVAVFNTLRGTQLVPAALVVGGLAEGAQLNAIRKGARFVVATPGRLEDYLDRKLFNFNSLRILVLDEADRMLDMGFLPAIKRIAAILPKERQTMCFSATMEASVAHLVKDYLKNPTRLAFGSTLKPAENVRMQAYEVSVDRKQEMLQRLLAKETGRCLVFSRTKRGTERITKSLNRDGFSAAMIHGDRSQSQRNAALAGFQQGRYRVLVATDLASRGIHVQDIVHVINYDLPDVAENFIHRVGRTGRAGGHGVASTLFTREQRSELFQLERTLGIRIERLNGDSGAAKAATGVHIRREPSPVSTAVSAKSAIRPTMIALPGEVLQAQVES